MLGADSCNMNSVEAPQTCYPPSQPVKSGVFWILNINSHSSPLPPVVLLQEKELSC